MMLRDVQASIAQVRKPRTQIQTEQPGERHLKVGIYMDKSGFFVNQPSFPLANSAWLRIFCRFTKLGQKSRQAVGGREMSLSFLGPITCLRVLGQTDFNLATLLQSWRVRWRRDKLGAGVEVRNLR